jgi:hypothetical protein
MSARSRAVVRLAAAGKALAVPIGLATTVLVGWLLGPEGLGKWTLIAAGRDAPALPLLINWTHPFDGALRARRVATDTRPEPNLWNALASPGCSGVGSAVILRVIGPGTGWLQRWFGVQPSDWWMVILCLHWPCGLAAEAQATLQGHRAHRLAGQYSRRLSPHPRPFGLLALLWTDIATLTAAVVAFTRISCARWGRRLARRARPGRTHPSDKRFAFGDVLAQLCVTRHRFCRCSRLGYVV